MIDVAGEPVLQVLAAAAAVVYARYPLLWVAKRRLG